MKELISIHNQGPELRADSREIAKLFGIEHQSLRELIEGHASQLEQLGIFQFETGKIEGRGRPEKFCYINFDHIAFLLTVSRPTEATKDLRLKLILAFRDARVRLRPVDHALLTIPDAWRKTFPDKFYIALLRLYGDTFSHEKNRPSWVGGWTNKFIYEPLYNGLPKELKDRRKAHAAQAEKSGDWMKMHQFIEKHAKKNLEDHITAVTTLLTVARSKLNFIEMFAAAFCGRTQLLLSEIEELSRKYGSNPN